MVIKHIVADEIKFNAMQQSCNLKVSSLVYKNMPLVVIENLMVFDIRQLCVGGDDIPENSRIKNKRMTRNVQRMQITESVN